MERIAEQSGFSSTRQLRRGWQTIHKTPARDARIQGRLKLQIGSPRFNDGENR